MRKILMISAALIVLISLNSCGVNNAIIRNHNQNATQVHLTTNNYQIVDKVSGSAEVVYVLIFGGMSKTQLFENAYAAMIDDAQLQSGAKALINVVTEDHIGGVPPFYYKRTITVSAHVIEFSD